MRYLICGDIHGNLPALELMLYKERGNFDQLICHGDVVNYGPWSNECVLLLSNIKGSIMLKGNHEHFFLNGSYSGTNQIAIVFFDFCYNKFNQFNFIKDYGESFNIANFKVQHTIFDRYIFKDTKIDFIDSNYVIGHSHQQFDKFVGDKRLLNTGSVGQNRSFINCINYIIYNTENESFSLKMEKYNHKSVIEKMESESYPKICLDYYRTKNILL
jgi:predicted phosphodiesterase